MAILSNLSEADRKRLAICYVHMNDKQAIDSQAAATFFNPDIQEASFKTQNSRSLSKYAKDGFAKLSDSDVNRFATCYIYANSKQDVDWTAARNAFDTTQKVQIASFKTQTSRILKKFNEIGEPAKTSRKRKAATETDDGEAGDGIEKPKAKRPKSKAKTKKAEKVDAGVVTDIDYENVFDEDDQAATEAANGTIKRESVEPDDY